MYDSLRIHICDIPKAILQVLHIYLDDLGKNRKFGISFSCSYAKKFLRNAMMEKKIISSKKYNFFVKKKLSFLHIATDET